MKIELTDMPPLPVPSIVHGSDAQAIEIIRGIGQKFLDTSPEHRMSAQQDVLRGSRLEYEETLGYALAKAPRARRAHAHARYLLPHHLGGPPVKWGSGPHLSQQMGPHLSRAILCARALPTPLPTHVLLLRRLRNARRRASCPARPGRKRPTSPAPSSASTASTRSAASRRCTSSRRAARSTAAATSPFTCDGPLPQLQAGMYGRAMVWLDAAPIALPGAPPVHWTLLQGEGRSADDRYNSIYRLGARGARRHAVHGQLRDHAAGDHRLQAAVDAHAARAPLGLRRVAFEVASNEMQFWLDGAGGSRQRDRIARAANACRGDDLRGEWRAPPKFDSLLHRLRALRGLAPTTRICGSTTWRLSRQRVGCPRRKEEG